MVDDTNNEYDGPTQKKTRHSIGRRTLLKLAGTATLTGAATATQAGVVSASSHGYGEGEYGIGQYGGTVSVAVATNRAVDVAATTATLTGSLVDIGNAESVTCQFEWRQVGDTNWVTSAEQTLTDTGSFDTTLSGLAQSTDHEFRAVGAADNGTANFGEKKQFTTAVSNDGPSVDSFTVTEAGRADPHADITVDWAVSDSDGNLDTVVVQVFDGTGTLVDAGSNEITGYSASGVNQVDIKHVKGQMLHIEFTVIDTHGANATQIKHIQE